MAIGTDKVQVLKRESAALGGSGADDVDYLTPINPQQDAIETCGIYLQDASNRDSGCYVERAGNNMRFRDGNNTTPVTLTALLGGASGSNHVVAEFKLNGKITTLTKLDVAFIVPFNGTIARVVLYRRTAGSSASTTVDVNKNGTTIYTTQGNRPSITQASGNDQTNAGGAAPDVTSVAQGDRIEVDVDAAEAGNPLDLAVLVTIQLT